MRRRPVSAMLVAAWLAACAGGATPRTTPERDAPDRAAPVAEPHTLTWLPDGSHLLLDGRWLFDPARATYAALGCRTPEGAPCRSERLAFAPVGTRYVVVDGQRLGSGSASEPARWEPLPRWLPGGPDELTNVAFWVAPDTLYVDQQDASGRGPRVCRTRKHGTDVWMSHTNCLIPEFSHLWAADAGPDGLLALHSSAEGSYGLRIARYDSTSGPAETAAPPLVLEGSSEVRVRFIDSATLELLSPCTLEGRPPPPCESPDRQTRWKLYAIPLRGGEPSLRRADLPAGVAADPRRARFGWVEREQVCVGDPSDAKPQCTPIPHALPRGS